MKSLAETKLICCKVVKEHNRFKSMQDPNSKLEMIFDGKISFNS